MIAKSSWNAAENSCECTVFPSKAYLVNHPIEEKDSPLPPEQCWVKKIRHWVGRIVYLEIDQHCMGEGGGKGQKSVRILLFVPTL